MSRKKLKNLKLPKRTVSEPTVLSLVRGPEQFVSGIEQRTIPSSGRGYEGIFFLKFSRVFFLDRKLFRMV